MNTQETSWDTLQDIRKLMDRSSRFISLSGLSGLSAGCWALAGAGLAHAWIADYTAGSLDMEALRLRLAMLALAVLALALASALFFTWRKARRNGLPVWDRSSRLLLINLLIPLVTGALFVAALAWRGDWHLVAPATLVFYGLALVNASKYTLRDIRLLGILDIILGLAGLLYTQQALLLWAGGFGILHIVYGIIMWRKYEGKEAGALD